MVVSAEQPSTSPQPPAKGDSSTITIAVLGMSCAACQLHVEQALNAAPGVLSAHVDLMRHRASVTFEEQTTSTDQILQVVRDSGYDAVPPRMGEQPTPAEPGGALRGIKANLAILVGIAMMVLTMPLAEPSGASTGLASPTPVHSNADLLLMHLLPRLYAIPAHQLLLTLLAITALLAVWAGADIYASAWRALLHHETNMNTLVALGTGVALANSAAVAFIPAWRNQPVYLDSVLLILGFLLLGKWLEGRARHGALAAIDSLAHLQPATARIRRTLPGGVSQEQTLPLGEVRLGDLVVVLPGERVPVDARIIEGRTTIDESMLTGESLPVERSVGERVLAGTLNFDGAIVCRAEQIGAETTLAQIARLVEQAQASRAPMQRLADRVSAIFVPVVLLLAVITCGAWLFVAHDITRAISSMVAVLVIACPCAMGLAVPAALTVAVGRAAQLGILIKGGAALERLASVRQIALDKTGTLTLGKPTIVNMNAFPPILPQTVVRVAAALEDRSNHPLAHAVLSHAQMRRMAWQPATDVQAIPGRGLSGSLFVEPMDTAPTRCLLGNLALFQDEFIPTPETQIVPPPGAGVTRLWLAIGGRLAGYFDAQDQPRPTARKAVDWLRNAGYSITLLTGDTASAAAPIAAALGIDQVEADLLPADKVARIRSLQQQAPVAMVGDGINDAAALAQADAGLAMGAGAALAQEAGDALLLTSDPTAIVNALSLARATVTNMRQNLAWAVGYNLIGIPLAAGLLYPVFHLQLTPWMAAAAMAFSSVSVLANSLRLRTWQSPLTPQLTSLH